MHDCHKCYASVIGYITQSQVMVTQLCITQNIVEGSLEQWCHTVCITYVDFKTNTCFLGYSIDYEPRIYKIDRLYLGTLLSSLVLTNIRFLFYFNILRAKL